MTTESPLERLRAALNKNVEGLAPIEHRLIRGAYGDGGELYQWYFEIAGYKPKDAEDSPRAFNSYELHPVISADEATGISFTMYLEHRVHGVGNEDQHQFLQLNPDTLNEFREVAIGWGIADEAIEQGIEVLSQFIDCILPVLDELELNKEVECEIS